MENPLTRRLGIQRQELKLQINYISIKLAEATKLSADAYALSSSLAPAALGEWMYVAGAGSEDCTDLIVKDTLEGWNRATACQERLDAKKGHLQCQLRCLREALAVIEAALLAEYDLYLQAK